MGQYPVFSEQSIEATHRWFQNMIKRITERDESHKIMRVMTWLFQRNAIYDAIGVKETQSGRGNEQKKQNLTSKSPSVSRFYLITNPFCLT